MTKIKKGVEIYQFVDYNQSHTCGVRKMLVSSFGKVQGTAVSIEDGKPVQYRLYVRDEGTNLVPVVDVPDVHAEALRRANEIKEYWTSHYRNRAQQFLDASDGYHINMTKNARIQIEQEPTVKFLNF